jgi:hypothetical protein
MTPARAAPRGRADGRRDYRRQSDCSHFTGYGNACIYALDGHCLLVGRMEIDAVIERMQDRQMLKGK